MASDQPLASFGGQAGDVTIGDLAGNNIYHFLADLPPGLARFLADGHESNLLLITALDRQSERTARLESEFRAYTTGEALERATRFEETDRRHRAEQAILMDGLSGIRDQIAEQARAIATAQAEQRRRWRWQAAATAIASIGLLGLILDRTGVLWLLWALGSGLLGYVGQ